MPMSEAQPLAGKVAVVAGATRHSGRGVAIELGIAGATVYCTGRSARGNLSPKNQPETIEETADVVDFYGGKGIPVRVDHTVTSEVEALFDRVMEEQGRLDLVANSICGDYYHWGSKFWDKDVDLGMETVNHGGRAHVVTTVLAARRMLAAKSGLIVSISDADANDWLYYALERTLINRIAPSIADDLRPYNIAAVSLLPGAFFQFFTVHTLEELQRRAKEDPKVLRCHTPRLIGRGIVALATDPEIMTKSGKVLELKNLVKEYNFTDIDGRQSGDMW